MTAEHLRVHSLATGSNNVTHRTFEVYELPGISAGHYNWVVWGSDGNVLAHGTSSSVRVATAAAKYALDAGSVSVLLGVDCQREVLE